MSSSLQRLLKYCAVSLLFIATNCKENKKVNYDLIIANVGLIDGIGNPLKPNCHIGVREGIISRIAISDLGNARQIIDGKGKYLIPGLFDAHVHTTNFEEDYKRFIHFGITSIFVPGGSTASNEYYTAMRALSAQDSLPSPRLYHTSQHFTMEGRHPVKTYNNGRWIEGLTVFYLRDTVQIKSLVAAAVKHPIAGIKLTIEEGPTPPYVKRIPQEFVDKVSLEARKNGVEVFAHVSDNTELRMAIKARIKNLLHYTGVNIDFKKDAELVDSIIAADISWVTTLMLDKRVLYPLNPDWINEVEKLEVYPQAEVEQMKSPEAIEKAKVYQQLLAEFYHLEKPTFENMIKPQADQIRILQDKGVNMVIGTDTGNEFIFPGFSVHEEMQMMQFGGISPRDIIKMASWNAAKMFKVDDKLGSIEEGKLADMILLSSNPLEDIRNTRDIHMVIKNGRIQQRFGN